MKNGHPRHVAFVLDHECDAHTAERMSFGMLHGRDAELAQLLRGVCDGAGAVRPHVLCFIFQPFARLINCVQAVYEVRLCCATKGLRQTLPKRWDRRRGRKKHGRAAFDLSDNSDYEYSSGEISDLELGYEEDTASFHFDIVDENGKKEDHCYLNEEYEENQDVFLRVDRVDEIALRFHSKSGDERPVFDDPNWR